MANQSYINIAGTTAYRKAIGSGTDGDPFIPDFNNPDLGSAADSPATSDAGSFSLIALFKRWLQRWTTFYQDFGTQAEEVSATGSLMARIRYIAANFGGGASSELSTTTTASVGATLTTVLDVEAADYHYLSIKIKNTGAIALSDFQVQGFYSSLAPNDYALLAGASLTNSYGSGMAKQSNNALIPVVDSFNLPEMGATSNGQLEINCSRYQRIRLQAKTASSTTSITIDGILKK